MRFHNVVVGKASGTKSKPCAQPMLSKIESMVRNLGQFLSELVKTDIESTSHNQIQDDLRGITDRKSESADTVRFQAVKTE